MDEITQRIAIGVFGFMAFLAILLLADKYDGDRKIEMKRIELLCPKVKP